MAALVSEDSSEDSPTDSPPAGRRSLGRKSPRRSGRKTRRKWFIKGLVRFLAGVLALAVIATPAYLWGSSRYFLGFEGGEVVLYRGLPYEAFGTPFNEEVEQTGPQKGQRRASLPHPHTRPPAIHQGRGRQRYRRFKGAISLTQRATLPMILALAVYGFGVRDPARPPGADQPTAGLRSGLRRDDVRALPGRAPPSAALRRAHGARGNALDRGRASNDLPPHLRRARHREPRHHQVVWILAGSGALLFIVIFFRNYHRLFDYKYLLALTAVGAYSLGVYAARLHG